MARQKNVVEFMVFRQPDNTQRRDRTRPAEREAVDGKAAESQQPEVSPVARKQDVEEYAQHKDGCIVCQSCREIRGYSGKNEQDQASQEDRYTTDDRRERGRPQCEDGHESPDERHAVYDEEHAQGKCFWRVAKHHDACKRPSCFYLLFICR